MLLRSTCLWMRLPRELRWLVLSMLGGDGAGTVRQVCKEWRDILDQQGAGTKTSAVWVTQSTAAVDWARANRFPSFRREHWAKSFMWHSPFHVLEYLNHKGMCRWNWITVENLVCKGRYDIAKIIVEKYRPSALVHTVVRVAGRRDDGGDFIQWALRRLARTGGTCRCANQEHRTVFDRCVVHIILAELDANHDRTNVLNAVSSEVGISVSGHPLMLERSLVCKDRKPGQWNWIKWNF